MNRKNLPQLIVLTLCLLSSPDTFPYSPPPNPHLAHSVWPIFHGNSAQTASSTVAITTELTDKSLAKEVRWVPIGPSNSYDIKYSGVYPDGGRVSWIGGSDLIFKLDTESLNVLSVYSLRSGSFRSNDEIRSEMNLLDELTKRAEVNPQAEQILFDRVADTLSPILRTTGSGAIYNLLSSENEYYTLTWDREARQSYLSVYGDATAGDRFSAIQFKRQWAIPSQQSRAIALNMTYDGWIIVATLDGLVYAVSKDFTDYRELRLPGSSADKGEGWMNAFMRNGIAVDDDGGIYILTMKHLHRVQWTGSELSLSEADGGWSETYEAGKIGGGITPTLIGWGDQDKLVISSTGNSEQDKFQVYWRDQIPTDWQGIPGESRRLAGSIPITFGGESSKGLIQEGSPIAQGFGFFVTDPRPASPFPPQTSADREIFASMAAQMLSRYGLSGASKYSWDPATRTLRQDWTIDKPIYREICTISSNSVLLCQGREGSNWTIEGLDWGTGKPLFQILVGDSQRFNSGGGGIRLTPDGNIEYPSALTWGFTHIQLKAKKEDESQAAVSE